MKQLIIVLSIAWVVFSSCKKKDEAPPIQQSVITLKDIPADPTTGVDNQGNFTGQTGKHYLLDIKTGKQVSNDEQKTTKWHFGFRIESRKVTIITNGGSSGPGGCQAQVVTGIFDSYKNAPLSGYVSDSTSLAIPNTVPSSWVSYDYANHTISPKAGAIIVLKTGERRYAKMELISFYKGSPNPPTQQSESGYFTLRYVYQPKNDTAF